MKILTILFLTCLLNAYTQKDVENSLNYYYKISRNLTPEQKIVILDKIMSKYTDKGLDLRKVEEEIKKVKQQISTIKYTQEDVTNSFSYYLRVKNKITLEERIQLLEKIMNKYKGYNLDLSEVEREIASLKKPPKPLEESPEVPVIEPGKLEEDSTIIVDGRYALEVGDILSILVTPAEELSRDVIVNPDGTITFPFVGSLFVKDLSLDQFKTILTEKISKYVVNPKIDVSIKHLGRRNVFIMGEVKSPGSYPYVKDMTISELINQAGGFTEQAEKKSVKIHTGKKEDRKIVTVDVEEILKSGDLKKDIKLKPGDVVEVPRGVKTITVMGEVKHIAGRYLVSYSEGLTVSKAISEVGGPTVDADLSKVSIFRETPKKQVIRVNIDKVYAGDFKHDLLLQPGDTIYVPRKPTASTLYVLSQVIPWLSALALILTIKGALGI